MHDLAADASRKAYELRDRVSERERLYIAAGYYDNVTGEVEKYLETLELWKRTYPNQASPPNNLALKYVELGQFERAAEEARKRFASIQLRPPATLFWRAPSSVSIASMRPRQLSGRRWHRSSTPRPCADLCIGLPLFRAMRRRCRNRSHGRKESRMNIWLRTGKPRRRRFQASSEEPRNSPATQSSWRRAAT